MSLEEAISEQRIKDYTNSLLYKVAKFFHRQNIDVDDENYENIVIRSGWTYIQGEDDQELHFEVDFGIEFDEAPLVFVSSGFARPVSEGAPTKLEDMYWYSTMAWTEKVISAWKDNFEVYLELDPYYMWGVGMYIGIMWVAIGKKT